LNEFSPYKVLLPIAFEKVFDFLSLAMDRMRWCNLFAKV
jgi:hypothetical protein